ncbi:MAG TPA: DMT family transporter [Dehalococcoidia bacterium]|jgi:drug/metabolite transporter (DMT)-like permease|nr:DMT family transporter [Dehalococcoidia bacterium]MDP6272486.1 DMT family transporter [Dehalococcoidia bacterium]MDP7161144.1 DMT family transporter [Dehalococcoidia bacterium]MDP7213058.1 DMT family transporter [Dehalococcoidia bacterium]MDP7515255.1 DMT family transporter [Dehalococcoidia bacterium]
MPPNKHRSITPRAGAFAIFVSALWSGNSIAIKAGLEYAPPLRLGWYRFVSGAVVIVVWALYTRADLRVRRSELRTLTILGLLFSVQLVFMNLGLKYTTAGHGAVLSVTFPIWMAILSHFFIPGDRLSPFRAVGIMVAYIGVVVISLDGLGGESSGDVLLGDILSIIAGFLLGARLIFNARLAGQVDPNKLLLTQAAFGTALFIPAGLIFEDELWLMNKELALSIFYQGAVIAGFGYIANLWLLQRYLPSQVGVLNLSQPIFGIILAWLILDEPLTSLLWAGAFLVAIGAGLAQRRKRVAASAPGVALNAPSGKGNSGG